MHYALGTHVVVAIPDEHRWRWANGAVEALNGTKGVIEKINEENKTFLVRFDEPAGTWFAHQLPPSAFWFSAEELRSTENPSADLVRIGDKPVSDFIAIANRVRDEARDFGGDRDDYVDTHLPFIMMTFVEMPPKELFLAHYEAYLDDRPYHISHGTPRQREDHPFCDGGEFTAEELYEGVCSAIKMFHDGVSGIDDNDDEDSAISMASSVMYTLHFDWV